MIGARMVIACVVAAAFVSPACAHGFPNKTIWLIVPLTPGGSNVSAAQVKQMNGGHKRNTGPMLSSLRCSAKTRSGRPCKSPSVLGKKRCRMHGARWGQAPQEATRTRLSMAALLARLFRNARIFENWCGRRASCSSR